MNKLNTYLYIIKIDHSLTLSDIQEKLKTFPIEYISIFLNTHHNLSIVFNQKLTPLCEQTLLQILT